MAISQDFDNPDAVENQIADWAASEPVPYADIEWLGLGQAALMWYPDEDQKAATRRIRGWKDDNGTDSQEFVEGKIRRKREGTAANSPWFVAAQDLARFTAGKVVNRREKTTALESTELWERFSQLTDRIETLADAKGKAEGKVEFFRDQYIPEKDARIAELETENQQLRQQLNNTRNGKTDPEVSEEEIVDLRLQESSSKPGFFRRMFSGKSAPVATQPAN